MPEVRPCFCIIIHLQSILQEFHLQQAEIGIIGGSGLYSMPGLTEVREVSVETPFGAPSDGYVLGKLAGLTSDDIKRLEDQECI